MTPAETIVLKFDLERAEAECERLRKLAHEAPLNPYRLDANGHRWVEQYSSAWASRSNDWVNACEKRDALRAALSLPSTNSRGGA
jgi:hypothetical protein